MRYFDKLPLHIGSSTVAFEKNAIQSQDQVSHDYLYCGIYRLHQDQLRFAHIFSLAAFLNSQASKCADVHVWNVRNNGLIWATNTESKLI